MHARVEVTAAVWAISTLPLSGELQPAHYCHNGVPATLCHVIRPSACPARLCVAQWSPSCRGVLASHTRGLDAYLNRQAQRIDQRHHNLLAFVTQHLQSAPAPAPAAFPAAIDTTDASRSERLLQLLLDQLGVAPEAVQAAWRGRRRGREWGHPERAERVGVMGSALAPNQLHAITSACRRHRVARLHAFGSVLRPDYRPGESDIDLLVEFQPDAPEVLYKTYFSLLNELRESLNAHIDLVMADAIRNPYIKDSIEASKQEIYAA